MKAFIALFALVAAVNADAEAEADPYYAYGGAYGGYAGFAGLAGYHGAYAGLPYGAYGYAHPAAGTVAVGPAHVAVAPTAVVKAVEHIPAKVEVEAIEGTVPVAVAAPAALTYHHAGLGYAGHHAGLGYAGLGAYGAYGLGAYGLAGHHVIGKREAEADADPAYFYNGYHGYAGYGYAGLGAYGAYGRGAYGLGAYGLGAYGAYGAYPYAAAYRGVAGLAVAPSDPTNPTAVHTSRFGICVNYLGAQVPC